MRIFRRRDFFDGTRNLHDYECILVSYIIGPRPRRRSGARAHERSRLIFLRWHFVPFLALRVIAVVRRLNSRLAAYSNGQLPFSADFSSRWPHNQIITKKFNHKNIENNKLLPFLPLRRYILNTRESKIKK